MNQRDKRTPQASDTGGSGATGGKEVLKPEQQEPMGVEPDSNVDAKLRRSKRPVPGTLEPNTVVRN